MPDLSFSDVSPRKRDMLVSMATVAVGITVVTGVAGIVLISNRVRGMRAKIHNGRLLRATLSAPLRRRSRP